MWKEVETRVQKQLVINTGLLWIKDPEDHDFDYMSQFGDIWSPQEIQKAYPSLKVPVSYLGIFCHEAGLIRVKESLKAFKTLSKEQGAVLKYNSSVETVDHKAGTVELENGQKI